MRSAIDDLQVERIGHGVRAIEDECLLAELAARRIPLEVCPISNVRTGVVASLSLHPVRQLHDRGCLVTVNTDDPKMFGNSLAEEYRLLERDCGFSREEIRGLIRNGVQATWMNDAGKRCMLESLENDAFWTGHADNTPSGGNA